MYDADGIQLLWTEPKCVLNPFTLGLLWGVWQPQVPVNNISTSVSDNSTAVYNYNLGFSINGSNGNAKDIANAVMREIKNVDSQRIRGQRQ